MKIDLKFNVFVNVHESQIFSGKSFSGDREMFLIKSLISVKFIQAICTYLETNKKKSPATATVPLPTKDNCYQSSKLTPSLLA